MPCRSTMSARANGRAIWSCSTKSPTGPADRSYGIAVAKLAGLPPAVLARAKSVLARLEAGRDATGGIAAGLDDLPLFAAAPSPEAPADPLAEALGRPRSRQHDPARSARRAVRAEAPRRRMTALRFDLIDDRRAIIDRRLVADTIAVVADGPDLNRDVCHLLNHAIETGRAEIARRLAADPGRGRIAAASYAFLTDQIIRLAHDFVTARLYPLSNPTSGERLSLVALGGSGRGEMAPFSDVDLMFLTPGSRSPWCEQVIEAILYLLWDLKLKVGQSSRSPEELVAIAKSDISVRTAMLEARWLWGDEALFDRAAALFKSKVVAGTAAEFVTAKLAERDERHIRVGDSRYVVEPNVKDGKGGLRDLHTLYWIGKYVHGVERPADLVDVGPADRRRVPPVRAGRALLLVGPLSPPARRRASRGSPRLRPPAPDRRGDALRRPAGQVGGRALHAILLPPGQDRRRPDRRVPRATGRAARQEGQALRPARPSGIVPPQAGAAQRLRARPGAAIDPQRQLVRQGSGAAGRTIRLGRARRPGDPPAGDARRRPRCPADRRRGARRSPRQRLVPRRADRTRNHRTSCCAG